MSPSRRVQLRLRAQCYAAAAILLCVVVSVQAQTTRTKANNTNNLNLTTSWVGGVVPSSTDIALWNSTVTGANTVSLGADLNFGEIQLTNPGGLVTINSGNTLTLSGVSGVGIDMSSATQNLTLNPTISLGASQIWNVGTSRTLTIGGTINGSGNTITKNGAGTLTLNGSNLFNNVGLTMNSGLTLLTTNNNQLRTFSLANLSGSGGTIQLNGNNSTVNLTVGSDNTSTSYGGTFNENGNSSTQLTLTKVGSGALTLNSANSYTGGTSIIAGSLGIGNNSALGTGTLNLGGTSADTPTIFASGAARTIANNVVLLQTTVAGNPTISGSNDLTINGTVTNSGNNRTLTVDNSGVTTLAGNVYLSEISGTGRTLTINGSGNTTISGVVANFNGSGTAGNLAYSGTGTLTLSNANTYSGTTTVNSGTLKASAASALGGTSGITVNNTGSLVLSASNTINNSATMALNGNVTTSNPATKNLVVTASEGSSTTTSATAGLGALTLQSRSTLDFLQSTSTIVFGQTAGVAFIDSGSFKLDIYNYIGDSTPSGNLDHLVFQQDMTSFTGDFQFWNGSAFVGATTTQLGSSGFWEITPLNAVPEPSTYFAAILALLSVGYTQRRKLVPALKRFKAAMPLG